ncbi:YgaP family membrane protein [Nocardia sp. NPDC004582]
MTATRRWTIDRIVPVVAGTMVLLSIALVLAFSPWWLLLTTFVAANLLLYGFAGWCPMTLLLRRLGVPRTGTPATERTA